MTPAHPFRFGVVARTVASARDWAAKARRAQELGYASLLVPDHFGASVSPLPALAAATNATTTPRLGSLVFDNDYRHSALFQKDMATLDMLTDGRVELGIGGEIVQSMSRRVFRSAHRRCVSSGSPKRWPSSVIKRLFRATPSAPFSFAGTNYQINELAGGPPPVQQPHPPIFIGGGRRLLSLAAREVDIVGLTFWRHPDGNPNTASLSSAAMDEQAA